MKLKGGTIMLRKSTYVLLGLGLAVITLIVSGCSGGSDFLVIDDDMVTFVNDYGEIIAIEPFGEVLYPGETVDIDIGNDVVYVTVYREFDGLILLQTDVMAGDVWVIQ